MPKKAKTAEGEAESKAQTERKAKPEAEVVETATVEAMPVEAKLARGEKTKAIRKALKAHKDKSPKEIAELVTAAGIPTTAGQVSNAKSVLAAKKKAKAAPAPVAAAETVPAFAVAKDAVSLGLLQKAKKLAEQLGGIKEAKAAIDALAQLID